MHTVSVYMRLISRIASTSALFFFSSRRRHTRFDCDWSSDVCSSDLLPSTGSPLTVTPRFVPCPWLYTLKLPAPVVPMEIEYCVAPAPALQPNVAAAPGNVEPSPGLVNTALADATSNTSTQSSFPGPPALLPGVAKSSEPA